MASDLVPGTLLASRPLSRTRPGILDLPVTVLDWFGLERPAQMVGRSLLG
jgi:bisphosphoglycerate-independent phosphoglycerate mutase (AlkP superfamily)